VMIMKGRRGKEEERRMNANRSNRYFWLPAQHGALLSSFTRTVKRMAVFCSFHAVVDVRPSYIT
jgi:hypothetical protein